ncbi:Forkhead box protein N3 [Armadillidium vulgare]|nr:Forkhead box protein N3 [Armadillidium vulgare]
MVVFIDINVFHSGFSSVGILFTSTGGMVVFIDGDVFHSGFSSVGILFTSTGGMMVLIDGDVFDSSFSFVGALFTSTGVDVYLLSVQEEYGVCVTVVYYKKVIFRTALSPIKLNTSLPKISEPPVAVTNEKKKNTKSQGRKDPVSSQSHTDEEKTMSPRILENSIKHEAHEDLKVESPTSDYAEDLNETSSAENSEISENLGSSNGVKMESQDTQKPQAIPYNPKIHIKAKPPFSFSCLIFMAIEESPTKALPVKDIYSWILDHYPYYRNAPTGWKNSVRHNLSLNKCFSKVEKSQNLGKGSLWMVDPNFRPNLLQAMSKTPFTTQSKNDKTYLMSNKAIINTKYLYGLTSKNTEKGISVGDFVVENETDVLPSNKTSKNQETSSSERVNTVNKSNENFPEVKISDTFMDSSQTNQHQENSESSDAGSMVISSSPSLDHSYVSKLKASQNQDSLALRDEKGIRFLRRLVYHQVAQKRSPFEEADALLNLASVATSLASKERFLTLGAGGGGDKNETRFSPSYFGNDDEETPPVGQNDSESHTYLKPVSETQSFIC